MESSKILDLNANRIVDMELNGDQLQRNDEIDNAVFDCIQVLAEKELDWNMQLIGEVTDSIKDTMGQHGLRVRHPGITELGNGVQIFEEYDRELDSRYELECFDSDDVAKNGEHSSFRAFNSFDSNNLPSFSTIEKSVRDSKFDTFELRKVTTETKRYALKEEPVLIVNIRT